METIDSAMRGAALLAGSNGEKGSAGLDPLNFHSGRTGNAEKQFEEFPSERSVRFDLHHDCGALLRRTAEGGCPHVILMLGRVETRPTQVLLVLTVPQTPARDGPGMFSGAG